MLFAFGPQLRRLLAGGQASTAKATVGVLAVAIYGGYFNGGLGILLLALFGLLGQTQLNAMNGLKNLVSALLTAIAVAVYAVGDVVNWRQKNIPVITKPVTTMPQRSQAAGMRRATRAPM